MHNNQTFHAKRIFVVLCALAALALSGCATPSVTNLTPPALAPSPSQTYKITARVKPSASNLISDSETVKIIIGGEAFQMTRVPNSDNLFEFDYKAPAGVTQFAYYFLVEYNTTDAGIVSARTDYSTLQHAVITDQIGTVVASNTKMANIPVPPSTTVTTANTTIPWSRPADWEGGVSSTPATAGGAANAGAVSSGPASNAAILAAAQTTAPVPADYFAPAMGNNISITAPTNDIEVSPSEISVYSGSYIVVKFIMPKIVTGSPLLIDVTTDIPDSVIMPEVYVKVGSNIATINLKGGKPGKGRLYVKSAAYPKTQIVPITVK